MFCACKCLCKVYPLESGQTIGTQEMQNYCIWKDIRSNFEILFINSSISKLSEKNNFEPLTSCYGVKLNHKIS